jgi:hypothetical protein
MDSAVSEVVEAAVRDAPRADIGSGGKRPFTERAVATVLIDARPPDLLWQSSTGVRAAVLPLEAARPG